ncbi:MAG: hypothetical protein V3U27_02395 [Candidatus Tectomicrobia bacterium]
MAYSSIGMPLVGRCHSGYRHDENTTVKGIVKGAIKTIAPLTYRQRYAQSSGRDPLICPHCQREMDVWRIWRPTSGIIYDELEAIARGTYAAKATRADPA